MKYIGSPWPNGRPAHGLDLLTPLVEAEAKDLKLMSIGAYGFSAGKLDEIGRIGRRLEQGGGKGVKRVGNLWPALTSFANLSAAEAAAAGKRKRPGFAASASSFA